MPVFKGRSRHIRYNFSKNELERLYLIDLLSTYSIARKLNCDPKTVYRYLKKHDIPTRPRKVVPIDVQRLEELYSSGQSMATLGKEHGICAAAVHRKIHAAKIIPRTQWESNVKYKRTNFSGDNQDKSYLIGFRIGDLNVITKHDPTSSIIVKSGTTKKAQLDLMSKIFSKYGHIWITGPHKHDEYQFQTNLNRSFEFLLPKHKQIPVWIINNSDNFWSFLAGYTDAEGNIGIYAARAKFRLRSYDKKILFQIHKALKKAGIQSLFKLEKKAGIYQSGKVKHNQDCWGVTVNHAPSLVILFARLHTKLQHGKRVSDANLAINNLTERGYFS